MYNIILYINLEVIHGILLIYRQQPQHLWLFFSECAVRSCLMHSMLNICTYWRVTSPFPHTVCSTVHGLPGPQEYARNIRHFLRVIPLPTHQFVCWYAWSQFAWYVWFFCSRQRSSEVSAASHLPHLAQPLHFLDATIVAPMDTKTKLADYPAIADPDPFSLSTYNVRSNLMSLHPFFPSGLPSASPPPSSSQPLIAMPVSDHPYGNAHSGRSAVMTKTEALHFYTSSCSASLLMPPPSSQHTSHTSNASLSLSVCRSIHSSACNTKPVKLEFPISKSHTRRCREKISRGFDTLLNMLPDRAPGKKVKHKAQILEQALSEIRSLLRQRTYLQANLVFTSTAALALWASSTLATCALRSQKPSLNNTHDHITTNPYPLTAPSSSHVNIGVVLQQFIALYCMIHAWPYAEVWIVQHQKHATPILSLSGCVYNVEDQDVARKLEGFAEDSRILLLNQTTAVSEGVLHRVSISGAPEWLAGLGVPHGPSHHVTSSEPIESLNCGVHNSTLKDRTSLARKWGLQTALVIPFMGSGPRMLSQQNESLCDAVVFLGDLRTRLFNMAEVEKLRAHLGVIYEEYKRFSEASCPVPCQLWDQSVSPVSRFASKRRWFHFTISLELDMTSSLAVIYVTLHVVASFTWRRGTLNFDFAIIFE